MANGHSRCSSASEDDVGDADMDSSPTASEDLLNSPNWRAITSRNTQSLFRMEKQEEIWCEYVEWCKESYAGSDIMINFGKQNRKLSQILYYYNEHVTESPMVNLQVCSA